MVVSTAISAPFRRNHFFASNTEELMAHLKGLGIDANDVLYQGTDNKVSDWKSVAGVYEKKGKVYAYGRSQKAEVKAALESS